MDVYVVEVVKVLPVESAEDKHTTAQEASAVTTSGLRGLPTDLQIRYDVAFWVEHEDIAEIIAEPAPVYVYLILVDCRCVPPTCEESTIFHSSLPPGQSLGASTFEKTSKVDGVYVTKAAVLAVTPGNNVELVSKPY